MVVDIDSRIHLTQNYPSDKALDTAMRDSLVWVDGGRQSQSMVWGPGVNKKGGCKVSTGIGAFISLLHFYRHSMTTPLEFWLPRLP